MAPIYKVEYITVPIGTCTYMDGKFSAYYRLSRLWSYINDSDPYLSVCRINRHRVRRLLTRAQKEQYVCWLTIQRVIKYDLIGASIKWMILQVWSKTSGRLVHAHNYTIFHTCMNWIQLNHLDSSVWFVLGITRSTCCTNTCAQLHKKSH
jgi:hypothetical protein